MKLPRHNIARNTVSELSSLRQNQITPGEAANVELAKWGAVTDGFNAASEIAETYAKAEMQRESEEGKLSYVLGEAKRDADYTMLVKDPDLQRKMDEDDGYFERSVADIEKEYRSSIESIKNPQIKAQLQDAQKVSLMTFRAEAEGDYGLERTKLFKNKAIGGAQAALLADKPDMAETIVESSSKYFSEAELARWNVHIHNSRIEIGSNELADMADDAYELNGIDGLNKVREEVMNNDSLDDELQKKALAKINLVESNRTKTDKARRAAIDLAEQQANDKLRIEFEYAITPATDDDSLNEFADTQELTYPQRKQLFEIRNKKINATQSVEYGNPNSAGYRDGLDVMTQNMMVEGEDGEPVPMPIEQQFAHQIAAVGDRMVNDDEGNNVFVKGTNAIGTNLTNSIIQDVASPEPEVNLRALSRYAEIMKNNPATKLQFDADTKNFLQAAYNSAKNNGGTEEAYAKAAKEQRAIHVSQANGLDTAKVASETYRQMIVPKLLDDVGDRLETKGFDIPGWFNDEEFQYDATFQAVLIRAGNETAQYMMATEGRIDPQYVINAADQVAISRVSPNFINDGVPSGGQVFLTNKGEQKTVQLKPQLSVYSIDGADTPEGAERLRSLMRDDYVENGTGLNGKKVKYAGKEYTLKAKRPEGKMPSSLQLKMGMLPKEEIEEGIIYIDDIEMYTSATPRKDDNGNVLADLRYLNIPIYSTDGKSFEAWNGYTSDGYFSPEGKTDISGGPTRADVNQRIKNAEMNP